jgi:hypothetical protein
MNYRFQVKEWLERFPLQERHGRYHAEIITSSWDVCQNERLRRELHDEYDWGTAVPVDIFIMADGEAPDRHVTKIGGLPFRPADSKWPTRCDGEPLVFLAQFNFSDSKDLTGELPGDVLLIFTDHAHSLKQFHFEWQRLGLSGLIEAHAIPKPPTTVVEMPSITEPPLVDWAAQFLSKLGLTTPREPEKVSVEPTVIAPCYGQIFRTTSFPDAVPRDDSRKYPLCNGKEVWSEHHLLQFQATQIGNAPFFIQEGDPDQIPGRLLCTLSSVQPACDVEFPWLNRQPPIPLGKLITECEAYLMIGDMGCIYISIDDSGDVHGHWSCY